MLDEIRHRLSRPSPAFWKKMQKRTAATSAAFVVLTVSVASIANHLPAIIPQLFGYASAFFGGISAMCMLTVDDAVPLQQPGPPAYPETPNPPAE